MLICTLFCMNGCENSKGMHIEKVRNAVIDENFDKTLSSYYYEEDDSNSFSIYGYSGTVSAISTLSIQNLYNQKKIDINNLSEKENKYYFSILKTRYMGSNFIDLSYLTNESLQRDYFEAFQTAKLIKDDSLLEKLKEKYSKYTGSDDSTSEQIFCELNNDYCGKKTGNAQSIDKKVTDVIKTSSGNIRFDIEDILTLNACLAYLDYNKTNGLDKYVKSCMIHICKS